MMRNIINSCRLLLILGIIVLPACDQIESVASGVGSASKSSSTKELNASASGSQSNQTTGADTGSEDEDSAAAAEAEIFEVAGAQTNQELTTVRLDAFRHFNCSSEWTNRDGGWGLRAGSGSGTCTAAFPGLTGRYRVALMAQLEFDGSPNFKISLDGATIAAGSYPTSKGELMCSCPNWRVNCPDRIVPIDAGVHEIKQGAAIEFFGQEVYPCGGSHGAYAKWRELVFTPAN
jgi:hypothetical protein